MLGTFGIGGSTSFSSAPTRGRMLNGVPSPLSYPSPFFDLAHTYYPTTVKQLFKWCRYYFLTNPLINAIAFKLSEYPVTDIIVDHPNDNVRKMWTDFLQDHLRLRPFQVEFGLDYHVYGNGLTSISYSFKKYIKCRKCKFQAPAEKIRPNWTIVDFEFRLRCPKCGDSGTADTHDFYIRNASGIKLIRWNPEDVEITYNDITGDYTYYYNIPNNVRNDIMIGKKEVIENTPKIFLTSMRQQKGLIFQKQNLFHMRRPTLAQQDRGWGTPLLLPVLKDAFYMQVMKKANEAILLEHIVPMRILFPQAGSGSADPYTSISLVDWKEHVGMEIARMRMDPNYIGIMPLPIGNQTIGGDGRALLMNPEIQQLQETIMMGMGVPREFVTGGVSYSGANVSLRIVENSFIGYISRMKALMRWIVQEVSSFLKWPMVNVRLKPFKMADDIQRKGFYFQLNSAGKLSDTTLLADCDFNQEDENQLMLKETSSRAQAVEKQQLTTAELQGKQQLIMSKYQVKSQQAMQEAQNAAAAPGEPGAPEQGVSGGAGGQEAGQNVQMQQQAAEQQAAQQQQQQQQQPQQPQGAVQGSPLGMQSRMQEGSAGGADITQMAYMNANAIASLPPDQQQSAMQNLYAQSPELADLVMQMLKGMGVNVGQPQQAASGVDMRAMPEQRPPRRQNSPM